MRSYRIDSPEATARVLVLALLADGGMDPVELSLLERPEVIERIGFDQACLKKVFFEVCEDLYAFGIATQFGRLGLDAQTIDRLLDEIRNPRLQSNVLRAVIDVVYANGEITAGESSLLAQATNRWKLECYRRQGPLQPIERRWSFVARRLTECAEPDSSVPPGAAKAMVLRAPPSILSSQTNLN